MNNYKSKIYFTLILGIIVLFILLFFMGVPLFNKIKQSHENILGSQIKIANLNKSWEESAKAESQLKINKENLKKIRKNLLRSKELGLVDFLQYVEWLELIIQKTNNSQVGDIKAGERIDSQKIDSNYKTGYYSFQVNLMGSYSNLLKFINILENGDYYTEITSLNISKAQTEKSNFEKTEFSLDNLSNLVKSSLNIKILFFDFEYEN